MYYLLTLFMRNDFNKRLISLNYETHRMARLLFRHYFLLTSCKIDSICYGNIKLLGLMRREFLDLLGQYNVSLFDDEIDLKKEAGYGLASGRNQYNPADHIRRGRAP